MVLRPLVTELQNEFGLLTEYDADDLRYIWRSQPPSLANQPDLILRAWQLGLLDVDEATSLLGTTAPDPSSPLYQHWLTAASLSAPMNNQDQLGFDDAGTQLNAPDGQPEDCLLYTSDAADE